MFKLFQKSKKKYSKEEIENYVKNKTLNRIAYGYEHATQTYKLAKKLGSNYDDEILHAACFLHDIEQDQNHEEKSANQADMLLKRFMPDTDRFRVKEAILNHTMFGAPKSAEAILVHDASLLNSLGAIGILQLTISHTEGKEKLKIREIIKHLKNYRKMIPDKLILRQSISLAADKLQVMDLFIDEAGKEYD